MHFCSSFALQAERAQFDAHGFSLSEEQAVSVIPIQWHARFALPVAAFRRALPCLSLPARPS